MEGFGYDQDIWKALGKVKRCLSRRGVSKEVLPVEMLIWQLYKMEWEEPTLGAVWTYVRWSQATFPASSNTIPGVTAAFFWFLKSGKFVSALSL